MQNEEATEQKRSGVSAIKKSNMHFIDGILVPCCGCTQSIFDSISMCRDEHVSTFRLFHKGGSIILQLWEQSLIHHEKSIDKKVSGKNIFAFERRAGTSKGFSQMVPSQK